MDRTRTTFERIRQPQTNNFICALLDPRHHKSMVASRPKTGLHLARTAPELFKASLSDTFKSEPAPQVANESQEDEKEVEHVTRSCHDRAANKIHPRMDLHILNESLVYRKVRGVESNTRWYAFRANPKNLDEEAHDLNRTDSSRPWVHLLKHRLRDGQTLQFTSMTNRKNQGTTRATSSLPARARSRHMNTSRYARSFIVSCYALRCSGM